MEQKSAHFGMNFMPMEAKRIILKIRILGRLKLRGKTYSYALIKEFEQFGLKFYGPTLKNDMYNALRALEKAGYIKPSAKADGGKIKVYYTITPRGEKALKSVGKMMIQTVRQAGRLFG